MDFVISFEKGKSKHVKIHILTQSEIKRKSTTFYRAKFLHGFKSLAVNTSLMCKGVND